MFLDHLVPGWFLTNATWLLPTAIATYYILWIIYTLRFHPLSPIPGPRLAAISRFWLVYHTGRGKMDHLQRHLHAKYGPAVRIAPTEVAISDPEAIKAIYRTQAPLTKTDFYPTWGNRSFSKHESHFSVTDEKAHAERRRIVNHVYTLSNVLQSEEHIDVCSRLFCQRLGEMADRGETVDLGEWLQWYAFDVIGELYFGQMFGFMENSRDHENYILSLDTLMPFLLTAAMSQTYLRPFILGSAIVNAAAMRALKAVDHIAAAARSCVAARVEADEGVKANRRDLLHQFLEIAQTKGEKVDFGIPEIEYEAYVGIFAGSDTTAIALRATFYFLMRNPTIYQQVQDEIDQAAAAGHLSNPIKYAEAIKLPLLCASIKEAMRLHPSVGLTMPRHSPAGGLHVAGVYIPEGYRVGMNAAVVQLNSDIFGSDPETFRPSRWLEGDNRSANMDKHMLHFGAGTRTCIGKNISLSEMHKLIPQVLRTFDLQLSNPSQPWITNDLWFNKQTGITVQLKRR